MAETINKYATEAAYQADTHATFLDEVSLVTETGDVHYDGHNVERPQGVCPDIGDALWIDSSGNKHFYKGSTVKYQELTAEGKTLVGAVAIRQGNKVCILHKDEPQYLWVNGIAWCITNIAYNQSNTITFQQRGRTAAGASTYTSYTIGKCTFTPTNIDDAVSKIDTWLQSNPGGTSFNNLILADYNWRCVKMDSRIWVYTLATNNSNIYGDSVVKHAESGNIYGLQNMMSLAGRSIIGDAPLSIRTFTRADGCVTWLTIMNQPRFRQVNSSSNSPSDALNAPGVYNESDFNGTTVLKNYYGTYEKYLDAMMLKKPNKYDKNTQGLWIGLAKGFTAELGKYSVGNTWLFPAAHYAATVRAHPNISVSGLNEGDWYIPGMEELFPIIKNIQLDGSDPVNTALINSNASNRYTTYFRWSAWIYDYCRPCIYHGNGFTDAYSFINRFYTPVIAWLEF